MSDPNSPPDITGPNDDELLGHGGVEVPTEGIDDVPGASDDEGDPDAAVDGEPDAVGTAGGAS
jgi:hypothetical protein